MALVLSGLLVSKSSDAGFDFVDIDSRAWIKLDSRLGMRRLRLNVESLIVMLVWELLFGMLRLEEEVASHGVSGRGSRCDRLAR